MRTQLKAFLMFCIYFNVTAFPAQLETVEAYIVFLSRTFSTVQSIKGYVSTVRFYHVLNQYTFPDVSCLQVQLLLKGLKKVLLHTPKQALPITPPILIKIFSVIDLYSPFHVTLWSSYLLAFYLFARKSNLVPVSHVAFNPRLHLQRRDILVCQAGLIVTLKWSKTIQCAERRLTIPVSAFPGSPLCPVWAFQRMCTMVPAPPEAPAFVIYSQGKLVPVIHSQFTQQLRAFLHKTGHNPAAYSGHSFRRGGATWAFQLGVPGELIQLHGDWKSDAYKQYIKTSFGTKLSVTSTFASSIYALT